MIWVKGMMPNRALGGPPLPEGKTPASLTFSEFQQVEQLLIKEKQQ